MPRIARKNLGASFFHIMVQGIDKKLIFASKNNKNKYIDILTKYANKSEIQLISYCIMDNHAHVLIYVEKIENMSKFMHSVNTSYSNYYNKINDRVGYVFRDRYKSEPIYKERYLLNCINYIHLNPVKAGIVKNAETYRYSSCNQYMNNKGISRNEVLYEVLGISDYKMVFENGQDYQQFIDIDTNINDKIMFLIKEYQKEKGKNIEGIMKDRNEMKNLILFLHDDNKVKYIEIAKTLGISKTKIFKIRT